MGFRFNLCFVYYGFFMFFLNYNFVCLCLFSVIHVWSKLTSRYVLASGFFPKMET